MKNLFTLLLVILSSISINAQVSLTQNMGTPASNTAITAYTGWSAIAPALTYTGSGDVRTTTPSSGYAGASGSGNVFLTNTTKDFIISGFAFAAGCTVNASVDFGVHKSITTENGSSFSVGYSSTGAGGPWTNVSVTFPTTSAIWYARSISIPPTANAIRFASATATAFRIDDVIISSTESGCLLPVELTKFDVKRNENKVNLIWATATELNNDHFEIQHSVDGKNFKPINQVKGNGTTPVSTSYNFDHLTPSVGINYYRLKQVDIDGKYEYSPIRSILFGKNKISVSPTFAKENVTIYVSDEQSTNFGIYNLAGQQVLSGKAIGQQRIDVGFLQTGMYFIRTEFGDVIRFIKE